MWAWVNKHPWLSLFLVLALMVAIIVAINSGIRHASCAIYGNQTERDTRYSMFVGCMVKTSNGWVPRHELRSAAE